MEAFVSRVPHDHEAQLEFQTWQGTTRTLNRAFECL